MTTPPAAIKEAVDRGIGTVTRSIEVYEADGSTLWADGLSDRLISGSVSLSYGDNERRTMDLTLNNADNFLRSSPNGFWYDKVLKIYRGVSFAGSMITSKATVIEHTGGATQGVRFASSLKKYGIDADFSDSYSDISALLDSDIIISFTGSASASAKATDLKNLYDRGRNIITIGNKNTSAQVPHLTTTVSKTSTWGISQPVAGNELTAGWTSEAIAGSTAGNAVNAISGDAVAVSRWFMSDSTYSITGSVTFNENGGKWFNLNLPSLSGANGGTQFWILLGNVLAWMRGTNSTVEWQTQIGEFVIDSINGDHFPTGIKINGRDYVKKATNSKLKNASSFAADTSVSTLITALAANSGIDKIRLAEMPELLGSTQTFDRGTPRWDIMREAAHATGYEIYFDNEGYLTTRKYLDPTLSPPSHTFLTGAMGNLASLSRATNDSRIYNHVVVYGDPTSEEQRMPYVGEAINTNSESPTNVDRIGDRYYSYASTFFTNEAQCQAYADRLLGLHALESFELSFSAINYPWLEVGEIGRILDPNAVAGDPDQYLIDTANIPLALGPMTMTGKRITSVG